MKEKIYYITDPLIIERVNEITERYYKPLYNMAEFYLEDEQAAADCVKDEINNVAVRDNIDGEIGDRKFNAYIYRANINAIINILKRSNREIPIGLVDDPVLNSRLYYDEYNIMKGKFGFGEKFDKYIEKLKPIDRRILLMHYGEDNIYETIADELGMKPATVSKRVQRAIKKLKKMIPDKEAWKKND